MKGLSSIPQRQNPPIRSVVTFDPLGITSDFTCVRVNDLEKNEEAEQLCQRIFLWKCQFCKRSSDHRIPCSQQQS